MEEQETGWEWIQERLQGMKEDASKHLILAQHSPEKLKNGACFNIADQDTLKEVWFDASDLISRIDFLEEIVSLQRKYDVGGAQGREYLRTVIHEALIIGYLDCVMKSNFWWKADMQRGRVAKQHDDQTLKRANDERSATRIEFWRPHRKEFRSLVSGGMKRDRARIVIGGRIAEGGGEIYSHKTLRKWLRLDGEAD